MSEQVSVTHWDVYNHLKCPLRFFFFTKQTCDIPPNCGMCTHFSVEDVHGESPARDPENGRVVKEGGEARRVQGGTGHQHLQVGSEPGDVFDQAKQDVRVKSSLVSLVDKDHTERRKTGGGKKDCFQLLVELFSVGQKKTLYWTLLTIFNNIHEYFGVYHVGYN